MTLALLALAAAGLWVFLRRRRSFRLSADSVPAALTARPAADRFSSPRRVPRGILRAPKGGF